MSILENQKDKEVEFGALTTLNIDVDDCRNIRDFYTHFAIEMPIALKNAIDAFEVALMNTTPRDDLIDLQNQLRVNLCVSIVNSEHPFFKDHLMEEIRSNANQIAFLASFDQQISETLDDLPKE
jgi:hypothetical protein